MIFDNDISSIDRFILGFCTSNNRILKITSYNTQLVTSTVEFDLI